MYIQPVSPDPDVRDEGLFSGGRAQTFVFARDEGLQ
jgi:hypothetical protein